MSRTNALKSCRSDRMAGQSIPVDGRRTMYGGLGGRASTYNSVQTKQSVQSNLEELSSEDIDVKCRSILAEIDRCENWKDKYIQSSVLHNVPQTFPAKELRVELEAELDRLLAEQILQEEKKFSRLFGSAVSTSLGSRSRHSKNDHGFEDPMETSNSESKLDSTSSELCLACNSRPCKWSPFCNADAVTRRKKVLYKELMFVQKQKDAKIIESVVAKSALSGGDTRFVPSQLIDELSAELKEIDSKLKLRLIDDELHKTYASTSDRVTIRSIHGFDTTVKRNDAILALNYEHDRHIASTSAVEIIDGILEWMLEGWWFGERDQNPKMSDAMETETLLDIQSFSQRGSLLEKALNVQCNSNADAILRRAKNASAETNESLKSMETNIRYRHFCQAYMYFRALHLTGLSKSTFLGHNDLINNARGPVLSEERKKMIQEEKNARIRVSRIKYAMGKAKVGEEKRKKREEREQQEKAKCLQWDNKKKQADERLAITVQRIYRGHLGRKVAKKLQLRKQQIVSASALMNGCALVISRVYRGWVGRKIAFNLRKEMAEFLFAIREEEAKDEAEEYLV